MSGARDRAAGAWHGACFQLVMNFLARITSRLPFWTCVAFLAGAAFALVFFFVRSAAAETHAGGGLQAW